MKNKLIKYMNFYLVIPFLLLRLARSYVNCQMIVCKYKSREYREEF